MSVIHSSVRLDSSAVIARCSKDVVVWSKLDVLHPHVITEAQVSKALSHFNILFDTPDITPKKCLEILRDVNSWQIARNTGLVIAQHIEDFCYGVYGIARSEVSVIEIAKELSLLLGIIARRQHVLCNRVIFDFEKLAKKK